MMFSGFRFPVRMPWCVQTRERLSTGEMKIPDEKLVTEAFSICAEVAPLRYVP